MPRPVVRIRDVGTIVGTYISVERRNKCLHREPYTGQRQRRQALENARKWAHSHGYGILGAHT